MRGIFARVASLWRGLRHPDTLDAGMADEMQFHLEQDAERLMREHGLDAVEARRQAALRFGGVEKYRGAARDALHLTWARGLSVDVKLSLRILGRYPGLTATAVFALALAIGAGAAYLEFTADLMHGRLPSDPGRRIVGIVQWDQQTGRPEDRVTFDYVSWRDTLTTLDGLAAYRNLERNLVTEDGRAEPARGAALTSQAFGILAVPPHLGRTLQAADEQPGAPPVIVIGHDVWTARFGSHPGVLGQRVRVGAQPHEIVGVMPEGFGFPVSQSFWVPLSLHAPGYPRREGEATRMVGRLRDGVPLEAAQAEVSAAGERLAAAFPETHRHLRPVVQPYVVSLWSTVQDSAIQTAILYGANLFFIGLLLVCGANIATLVFARTVTRETEFGIRTALGASRARIVGQMFTEAAVLSILAAAIGLLTARASLLWVKQVIWAGQGSRLMYWWNDDLSPATYLYAAALALLAAVVIGVVPALKATGAQVQDRLRVARGASAPGLRFGGVWTAVIVAQIALTVVFLAVAGTLGWGLHFANAGERALTIPADDYVAMRLTLDAQGAEEGGTTGDDARGRRLGARYEEFARQLAAEPGVTAVTYGSRLPGMDFGVMPIEVDGQHASSPAEPPWVRTASVAVDYLPSFQASMVSGRGFTEADLAPGRRVAIVDQTFARLILGGGPAVGRHLREAPVAGQPRADWIEIVGVVRDLTVPDGKRASDGIVFIPAPPHQTMPLHLAVRAGADTTALLSRLRVVAAGIDADLRLNDLQPLHEVRAADRVAIDFFGRLLTGIGLVALFLACAGVYALMSFTVSRRTMEIGIRLALGAGPRRVVFGTFARALAQVAAGVVVGSVPAMLLVANLAPEVSTRDGAQVALIAGPLVALAVAGITALACVPPVRRALRIQPTEALKSA
ncbi:MAG: ABC transporter permease [Vicinamibacterales bacterium]|nr:ABC transporter permease [Vicinamibacterales bacterium]